MKKIITVTESLPVLGIEFLNENEMLSVRGGSEPLKPRSRPRDVYDYEKED